MFITYLNSKVKLGAILLCSAILCHGESASNGCFSHENYGLQARGMFQEIYGSDTRDLRVIYPSFYGYLTEDDFDKIIICYENNTCPHEGDIKSLIMYCTDGRVIRLNEEKALPTISMLIKKKFPEFPAQESERYLLIETFCRLRLFPDGKITDKGLSARGVPDGWLLPGGKGQDVFDKFCIDPQYSVNPSENYWNVSFYFINALGAVYEVRLKGELAPFFIVEALLIKVMENGSFHCVLDVV